MKTSGFDARFRRAYEALFPVIYRVALRIAGDSARAEDMCHEAFLRYYQKGHDLPDLEQTRYWLIRVVKNLSYNSEKRRTRENKAVRRLGQLGPHSVPSSEDDFLREVDRGLIRELLQLVPHNLRVPLVLREYEGLTYREISNILNISEGNVKVRIFRGREKLAELFKERVSRGS
jgi:RNA polymerase sigma-70 factor (ECF subfamily)